MTELGTAGSAPSGRPGTAPSVGGARDGRTDRIITLPNAISALRLLLVPVFTVLLLQGQDLWALVVLAVSGASDWLDGVLARRLGQQSRLGELLDPAADRLFILVTLVVLTLRDVVPIGLTIAIVGRDLLLCVVLAVLMATRIGPLPVHFGGKAGTFALLYAFPLLLLATWEGAVGAIAGVVGWAFAWWGVGLYWLAAGIYLVQAARELGRRHRPGEAAAEA